MQNSKLELPNIAGIKEINNCDAEVFTGGDFRISYGQNFRPIEISGTNSGILTLPVSANELSIINTNPGADDPNDVGHKFMVEFQTLDGMTVDTDEVSFGKGITKFDQVVSNGAQQFVITQAS